VISLFSHKMRNGHPLTIYGDGEQSRDFIFVEDVAAAFESAMQALHEGKLRHGIFNVCTGRSISVNQLAQTIAEITGATPIITRAPARSGEVRHSCGDTAQAREVLGFSAVTPLSDGLSRTLRG
ncbi:MAG: NAD-dependent epimerase/dehydratase family protein, partial [Rickettsiales bacterium]|nr:NAD-dependent epimerase/dehydratase family protein [Rickettsiales bacterium]